MKVTSTQFPMNYRHSIWMVDNQMCVLLWEVLFSEYISVPNSSHPALAIHLFPFRIHCILNVIMNNVIKFVRFLFRAAFELKTLKQYNYTTHYAFSNAFPSQMSCILCLELQLKWTFFNFCTVSKHGVW